MVLYKPQLSARLELGKLHASIGSTDAPGKEYLVEDDDTPATGPSTDNLMMMNWKNIMTINSLTKSMKIKRQD
jgi:hypothetical protein